MLIVVLQSIHTEMFQLCFKYLHIIVENNRRKFRMARPRKQTYPLETYLNSNKDGDISNNADTQRKPAWKAIINGLIVTILTDDYIPPIILAEENNSQLDIVDGGSRTAAFMMYRYGNYKITSSVENSVIQYKRKDKDEDGNIIWKDATFDIKGKTYDQLPEELKKKFNAYQIETVIHENCDKNRIATYIKRYNEHSSMNTNQKAFTYIDNFANRIRKIMNSRFFVECNVYSDNDNEKGAIERIIVETVMCMNHLESWSKEAKKLFIYINEHATENEFDSLEKNLHRLENIITSDIKDIFNKKDSFIFLTLFDRFTKLGIGDSKFAEFLREFKMKYRGTCRNENELLFDEIKQSSSTKAKQVIMDKLDLIENLMNKFLHANNNEFCCDNVEEFIKENLNMDVEEFSDDLEDYSNTLDKLLYKTVKDGSKLLDNQNRLSLLAMMVYSYKEDKDLDNWMAYYAKNNNTYFVDQKKNFLHMKNDFDRYCRKHKLSA